MGTQPWRLVWRDGRKFVSDWTDGAAAYVVFTGRDGKRRTHSAGTRDPRSALAACAKVYAEVTGAAAASHGVQKALPSLLSDWVDSKDGVLDPQTVASLETYAATLHGFGDLAAMGDPGRVRRYVNDRLREVLLSTVKKEVSALRSFVRWARDMGLYAELPAWVNFSAKEIFPSKAGGKRAGAQRGRPNELTTMQVEAFLAALPVLCVKRNGRGRKFPVRARLTFAYATGLRPATIDALLWTDLVLDAEADKATRLRIRRDIDKARYERTVPLSTRAVEAIEAVRALPLRSDGRIFGEHDYRDAIRKAAAAAALGVKVAPYDLRHARATHWLEAGVPLPFVAFLIGHMQMTTTNRYIHPSAEAARSYVELGASAPAVSSAPAAAPPPRPRVRFHLQPTTSFPDGPPYREQYATDEEQLLAARAYAGEWRSQYECSGCDWLPDCPQHGMIP